jgi:hypothetical protein
LAAEELKGGTEPSLDLMGAFWALYPKTSSIIEESPASDFSWGCTYWTCSNIDMQRHCRHLITCAVPVFLQKKPAQFKRHSDASFSFNCDFVP